jgi:hypothetical protein
MFMPQMCEVAARWLADREVSTSGRRQGDLTMVAFSYARPLLPKKAPDLWRTVECGLEDACHRIGAGCNTSVSLLLAV